MIKFYYSTAPNPMKVALCLEEMGLAYEPIPVDTRKAEQHKPDYLAINPNAKVPSIVDGEVTMFDSNAIVLYLAEKTGKFLPAKAAQRGPMLSWLMFVASGIGPFTGEHAAKLVNIKRLVDEISARPAAQKAIALKDRHAFKTENDEEAKRAMFPH